jgi:hypothetical protein
LTYLTHSLSEDVKVPLKLALTRKILREMGTTGPLKCFFRNLLIPKLEGKPNAKKNYVKLIKLDEKGWMTRIVLRVTNDLDKKSEREGCLLEVDQELNAFIQYAHNLSKSGRPFKNTLDFVGRNIKVSTIFVGNAITKLYGLEPYISRIKQCLEEGARLIFVASIATSESNNISVAEEIVKCNFEGLVSVEEAKAYTLRSNPELQGYCAALRFS